MGKLLPLFPLLLGLALRSTSALGATPPVPVPAAAPRSLTAPIEGLSLDRVYLAIGTRDGVRIGMRGQRGATAFVIDAVADHAASFACPDAPGTFAPGETVELGGLDPAAPALPPEAVRAVVGPQEDASTLYPRSLGVPALPPPVIIAEVDRDAEAARKHAAEARGPWRGWLALSASAVRDFGDSNTSSYQVRLDSRLLGENLAGGHLRYDHRLAIMADFGSAIDRRPEARRWVRADWLNLTYYPVVNGPYALTAGRMTPVGLAMTDVVDGARFGFSREWGGVSVTAGLGPRPTDGRPDIQTGRADIDAYFQGKAGGVQLRGDVGLHGALTNGAMDRTSITLGMLVRKPGLVDFHGYGELGWLPADLRGADRAAFGLDRLHAFFSLHPHRMVDLDVRYALDRPIIDRYLASVVPADYLRSDLRHVAAMTMRVRVWKLLLEPTGSVDVSPATGVRGRVGGRVTADRIFLPGMRISLNADYGSAAHVDTVTAGLRVAHQALDELDVWAGYNYTLVTNRGIEERYGLHSADAGVAWVPLRFLSTSLELSYYHGAFERVLAGFTRIGWWF